MIALAVLAEVFAVVGVVLCAPSLYRRATRRRPEPPLPDPDPDEPVTGAFGYDNGVTTGPKEGDT